MTTHRERITKAIEARLSAPAAIGLPAPVRGEDDPRTRNYVPAIDGVTDPTHFLALLDEGVVPRPDCPPVMGVGGTIYAWNLKLVAAYSVRSDDPETRKRQRAAGVTAISAAILPASEPEAEMRRLGGLAEWMWAEPAELLNDVYDADVQLAVARVHMTIWFSARDPNA